MSSISEGVRLAYQAYVQLARYLLARGSLRSGDEAYWYNLLLAMVVKVWRAVSKGSEESIVEHTQQRHRGVSDRAECVQAMRYGTSRETAQHQQILENSTRYLLKPKINNYLLSVPSLLLRDATLSM